MGSRTGLINQGRRRNQAMLLFVVMSLPAGSQLNRNRAQTQYAVFI